MTTLPFHKKAAWSALDFSPLFFAALFSPSAHSADIAPMKNGPTVVTVKGNRFNGVKNKVRKLGDQVTIRE
jgi:hypothetical protein